MRDFSEIVDRMRRGLAAALGHAPELLNVPGRSLACKIDPLYYLAPHPGCLAHLARLGATTPRVAAEVLTKTGLLITDAGSREAAITLRLVWGEPPRRPVALRSCFLDAEFVDRGLKLYAGLEPLPVSSLRILAADRPLVERFLQGKTALRGFAFFQPTARTS